MTTTAPIFTDVGDVKQKNLGAITFSDQSGTSYTLALGDAGTYLNFTNAGAVGLTVPADADVPFAVGTQISFEQAGAGQVTVAGADGVTVNATPTLMTAAQFAVAVLIKKAANTWTLTGNLATS